MVHVLVISCKNKYYSKGLEGWIQKTLMLNIKYKSCYSGHHQKKKKKRNMGQICQMCASRIPTCSWIGLSTYFRFSTCKMRYTPAVEDKLF